MTNTAMLPTKAKLKTYWIRLEPFGFIIEIRAFSRKDAYAVLRERYSAA